jgi:hypothetical protein
MSRKRLIDLALRVAGVMLALWAIWWALTHRLSAAEATVVGICSVLFVRSMIRTKLVQNPTGEGERNFAWRPAAKDLLKSAVCILAAFAWIIPLALAIRYRLLPDTAWVAYGLLGGPLILLLVAAAYFMVTAGLRAMFGSPR